MRAATARTFRRLARLLAGMPDMLVALACVALLWVGTVAYLDHQTRDAIAAAQDQTERFAIAFEESVARRVDLIDSALLLLRDAYLTGRDDIDMAQVTRGVTTGGPVFQFGYIDADGVLVATNLRHTDVRMDLSDRPHFRAHAENPGRDKLFVSLPVIGRASGKISMQFSRRVADPDGSFRGVVVASITPPGSLTSLHSEMGDGKGMLMLLGTDGALRARSPAIGREAVAQALAAAVGTTARGSFMRGAGQDLVLLGSYRQVSQRPLTVAVALTGEEVLGDLRSGRRQVIGAAAAVSLAALLAGGALTLRRHRLARSRRDLAASREALADAVESVSQGVLMTDSEGRVTVANRRAPELLGLLPEALQGRPTLRALSRMQFVAGEFGTAFPDLDAFETFSRSEWQDLGRNHVYERKRPDGTVLEVRTHALPSGGAVRTYTDITERHLMEEQARHFALHDSLTGLSNRVLMGERLVLAVQRGGCAVLFLDLDHFKLVNDRHGHDAGDRLLVEVAVRLRAVLRAGDTLARLGGDEFAILLSQANPAMASAVARHTIELLQEPFELDGRRFVIGASIGIALHPRDGTTPAALLCAADTAMYAAKRSGRNTFALYDEYMERDAEEQRSLERDLREAVATGQFHLVYQPVCSTHSGEVASFEALIRWCHPVRGHVPPSLFIPVAEQAGLILPIGAWVLETACSEAAAWPRPVRVAVNMSPPQFLQHDLCDQVRRALDRAGLPPDRLDIEVTEGLMLGDEEVVLTNMTRLRAMGVRISLDDFGTGHSSLSYLRRFPFDRIKIDRSFVQNLGVGTEARAIVHSVLSLGRNLKLDIIAEGVETELQLHELRMLRCELVQGYLLGKPMTMDDAVALLRGAAQGMEGRAAPQPTLAG
ncbi:bifunctional diguanylate cyclase/phosphodiesterase [Paracraurococcus lichenis]|uniref:EAL domain-containing protein n=1 Tax=Paracraurococcus lichenis TaxID=3064888 RepID=A0ABT9ECN5_9PROT|nr:EAL domain-containing protein [Paracraurococcus sp. LOR1-02]MDO9713968.1 EAL domain-containing protein [Paracraurococcus sp. LOR1-02]